MIKRLIALIAILIALSSHLALAQVQGPTDIKAPSLPDPKLVYTGKENYEANGQKWTRYKLSVTNRNAYPASLWAPSPTLPPCGANNNASRTWIDIIDSQNGTRIYGFCAIGSSANLDDLWFAVKQGEQPPKCVHIVMTDRRLHKTYKSNKVCFGPAIPPGPGDFTIGDPDLSIGQFSFKPGDNKVVRVLVMNNGPAISHGCVLRLTVRKINGTPVGRVTEINVPAIQAGHKRSVFIDADAILPKSVALKDTTFKLNVDAKNMVKESNESNNEVWHNL